MAGVASCDLSGDRLTDAVAACVSAARANAPPAVFQMGPLDGTWLARLVAGMLVWEGAFRCVSLVVARRPLAAPATAAAVSREERDLWRVLVPSYTVSTLHALLMCWRGSQHVVQLWRAPEAEKMLIIPNAGFYAQNQAVELSNWVFLTYMVYDMAHVVAVYPRLGGTATVFHHASFATAALVAGVSRAFPFAFGWLTLCEISTPFLNLRWLFKTLQRRDPARLQHIAAAVGYRTLAGLEYAIDLVFAITFVAARVVGYGAGLTHLLLGLRHGYFAPIGATPRTIMLTLVSAGFALNLTWTQRLVAGLHRSAAKKQAAEAEAAASAHR